MINIEINLELKLRNYLIQIKKKNLFNKLRIELSLNSKIKLQLIKEIYNLIQKNITIQRFSIKGDVILDRKRQKDVIRPRNGYNTQVLTDVDNAEIVKMSR